MTVFVDVHMNTFFNFLRLILLLAAVYSIETLCFVFIYIK